MNESELRKRYPRAFKLMDKGQDFLVIGDHEPYYQGAYRTIRTNEMAKGTWTPGDEQIYREKMRISTKVVLVQEALPGIESQSWTRRVGVWLKRQLSKKG